MVGKDALDGGGSGSKHADHQVLHGEIFVPHGLGRLLRGADDPACLLGQVNLGVPAHLGQGGDSGVQLRKRGVAVHAHTAQQGGDQAAVLVDQGVEQVLRHQVIVMVLLGHGLGRLDGFQGFLGIFFSVHNVLSRLRYEGRRY